MSSPYNPYSSEEQRRMALWTVARMLADPGAEIEFARDELQDGCSSLDTFRAGRLSVTIREATPVGARCGCPAPTRTLGSGDFLRCTKPPHAADERHENADQPDVVIGWWAK